MHQSEVVTILKELISKIEEDRVQVKQIEDYDLDALRFILSKLEMKEDPLEALKRLGRMLDSDVSVLVIPKDMVAAIVAVVSEVERLRAIHGHK